MNGNAYRNNDYTCDNCRWQGSGEDCPQRELFHDLFEIDCPRCGDKLDIVSFPDHAAVEKQLRMIENGTFKDETIKPLKIDSTYLQSKFQLPDIDEDFIVLVWDATDKEPSEVRIKFGGQVIWKEPVVYARHERFIEVCNICKEKYGLRLKDIIPTRRGEHNLCGDSYSSKEILAIFRESFANTRF